MTQTNIGLKSVVEALTLDSAQIYDGLHRFLKQQQIIPNFDFNDPFGRVMAIDNWENGLKQYIGQGYLEGEDFTYNKNITIDDFNAKDNNYFSVMAKTDTLRKYEYKLYPTQLMEAFSSAGNLGAFMAEKASLSEKAHRLYILNETAKIITKSTDANITIVYDKDENIKHGTANASVTTFNETDLRKWMDTVRTQLISFKIPSHKHTKFGSTPDTNEFKYSSFKYVGQASNFTLLISPVIYNMLANLKSTAYHKEDILLQVKTMPIDFSLIDGVTDADKIGGFLIDNRALYRSKSADETTSTKLPNGQLKVDRIIKLGFARLPVYPIIRYKFA